MVGVYVLAKPFMGHQAGETLQLDQDEAQALLDAGVIEEASSDDIGGDEPAEEEDAMGCDGGGGSGMTRAIERLTKNVEASIAKATEAAISKSAKLVKRPSLGTVPAEVKEPIFKNMGDLIRAEYRGRVKGDRTSMNKLHAHQEELRQKAPLGMSEGTNSAGGYSVIPEWFDSIWDKVREYPRLLEMTDKQSISGSTLNIPALSETSLVDGSRHGGILAYWVSEGSTLTSSYPSLTQVQAVLNTQAVVVYLTNQLLEDNAFNLDDYLGKKVALEFTFQENIAVHSASGSGQPTGIVNQPAYITIAKEAGQAAASVVFPNLSKMWGRLYPPSRPNAVWLCNPEVHQQLLQMTFPNASGSYPMAGLTVDFRDEYALRIFGRPVIEVLSLPQLGLSGDIILCDLSQLVCIEKPGMEVAVSDQIQFLTLQQCYRFVRRYDIKSPWTGALTPYDGSANTFSPFIGISGRGT